MSTLRLTSRTGQRFVRNDIPLIWLAEARGYDFLSMRRHFATELEKENAELREENAALRRVVSRGGRV
jgi:hypothetical protein